MADDYGGFFGALVSAFRRSDAYFFRAYVVVSVLVGTVAALFLLLGLVFWLGTPTPFGQQALLGVIAILVFVPLFAPVLVVARRHRRGVGDRRADAIIGLSGFGFVVATFLMLLISDPNPHDVGGPLAPAIAAIDALPRRYWIVPPLLSAVSIWLAVRLTRPVDGEGDGGDGAPDALDGPGDGAPERDRDRAEG